MRFFEKINNNDCHLIKIFGKILYSDIRKRKDGHRIRNFLNILTIDFKFLDVYHYISEKKINVFNKTIALIKKEDNGEFFQCSIWGIVYKKIFLQKELKKKILCKIQKGYDGIYVLNGNSGEIYLFLTYVINAYLKKNNTKRPLLVATKKYHIDMIKVICPNIPYTLVNNIDGHLKNLYFKIDDTNLFLVFPKEYFLEVEEDIRNKNSKAPHYFLSMLKQLGLTTEDIEFNPIKISDAIKNSTLEKIQATGLNLDKFIFIAPEAKSCKWVNTIYWKNLIQAYQDAGYDVFINKITDKFNIQGIDYKHCFLTYPEAFVLAQKAKKIIALRSGFAEFLSQTNVPLDIIYTDFERYEGNIESEDIKNGFSVKKLPYINTDLITENAF